MTIYECRALDYRDLDRLTELHLPYYSHRTADNLKWQFFGHNLTKPGVIVGAFDGNRLIGSQAYIPFKGWHENETILTAKSELTLIHPDYRGVSLFSQMYQYGFQLCREAGISCIWGFTGAVKPFKSVGFEIHGPLYSELIVWRPIRLLLEEKLMKTRKRRQVEITSQHSRVSLENTRNGSFGLIRDERYIAHRYDDNPMSKIAFFDSECGVLFSYNRRRNLLLVSEVIDDAKLIESVQKLGSRFRSSWSGLMRICTNPQFGFGTIPGAMYRRKISDNAIVFKWLDRAAPLPVFAIEEGYTEGL